MLQFRSLTPHSGEEKMATVKHNKIKLREVNRHLVCRLCRGYYVDATTIAECLHSFCRSCIIKYLEKNSFCPICEVQIHKTKPYLSLRLDKALQDVVYKVVPGLYHNEMRRRREFYSEQKEQLLFTTPEQCGLEERIIFSPEDSISLSLEYYDSDFLESETVSSQSSECGDTQEAFAFNQHLKLKASDKGARRDSQDTQEPSVHPKRYLQCPAVVNIGHLKKFIRMKYELNSKTQVDIIHKRVPLPDHYTLMDIAYIYTWKRSAPLRLFYQIYRTKKEQIIIPTSNVPEAKNAESHPLKDLDKEKREISVKLVSSDAVSKVNKNINGVLANAVGKLACEMQKPLSNLTLSKNSQLIKSVAENKNKETGKITTNENDDARVENSSRGKNKIIPPLKNKTSDKVALENKSKLEKSHTNICKVQKLAAEEVKENKSNIERLLLNPVSGKLESVPFEEYSHTGEKKDKVNSVKGENKKESASAKKIKTNKIESENARKEKMYKKDSLDVRKEKGKKETEKDNIERLSKKESAVVRKENANKKDSEDARKVEKKEPENVRKDNGGCGKELQSVKKEIGHTKVSEEHRNEVVKKEDSENVKMQVPLEKETEDQKEKDSKKEEDNEKKSNLDMLKSFRKEKQLTKEGKIEVKTSSGSSLTITALPRIEKETPKKAKDDNVYDFDGSNSPEKNDLFSKQLKNTKSKYLMEHRDKWLAKEAAGEWMTFQQYREMLLRENSATENVCTRAKRKSVPNLFRISPEENRRGVSKDHAGKLDEIVRGKKSPIVFNIHTNDEVKKIDASKNNTGSPPRPIKIENKGGEYFIKQDHAGIDGKSPDANNQKKDEKLTLCQKIVENYQAKVDEAKKSKTNESENKNFGAIDLTKAETNPKERKLDEEKTSSKEEEKTTPKTNLEPLLRVPQYSQNSKNTTSKEWPSLVHNLSPSDLSQAFMHLKHLDALNQFKSNALLEQFARKTGNLDLLYQQKIDFIRKLKRHQQANEDVPEKKQKHSPPGEKRHSPNSDTKDKPRPSLEEVTTLKNAEDLKTLSRIQDLLEIQRVVTQNFKMPPALLQFYGRPRPYPPPISSNLPNSKTLFPSHSKSQNVGSPSGTLPPTSPNASFLDSANYGHLLSAAGLHTEMSFHQTFKNYLRRQEENPQTSNLTPSKKVSRVKEESKKSVADKTHNNLKMAGTKQETAERIDAPET